MDLAAVMDDLGAALATIGGLTGQPYWADRVTPPAAIVGLPDGITFDATYGRGSDTMTLPVFILVGRTTAATARTILAAYCNGSGARSVKAAIEAHAAASYDTVRVAS